MGCVAGSLGVGPSAPVQAMVHSCIGGSLFQKPRLRGSLCRVPQASCRHLPHPAASAHRRSSHAWPVSVVACRRGSQDIGGLLWRRIISTLNQNPPGHRSGRLLSHPRLCRRPCHVCQDLFRKSSQICSWGSWALTRNLLLFRFSPMLHDSQSCWQGSADHLDDFASSCNWDTVSTSCLRKATRAM